MGEETVFGGDAAGHPIWKLPQGLAVSCSLGFSEAAAIAEHLARGWGWCEPLLCSPTPVCPPAQQHLDGPHSPALHVGREGHQEERRGSWPCPAAPHLSTHRDQASGTSGWVPLLAGDLFLQGAPPSPCLRPHWDMGGAGGSGGRTYAMSCLLSSGWGPSTRNQGAEGCGGLPEVWLGRRKRQACLSPPARVC